MDYLLCYDVNTTTTEGERRLRRVATASEAFGIRVQKSVFECVLSPSDRLLLLDRLRTIIDPSEDRVALYPLAGDSRQRADRIGQRERDIRDPLVL